MDSEDFLDWDASSVRVEQKKESSRTEKRFCNC